MFNHHVRLRRRPLADRLASETEAGPGGCVVWTGTRDGDGYGRLWVGPGGRTRGAHVVAYELRHGPVPDALELDHLCRVPACVNPAHLEPVTHRENVLRGESPTARNAQVTRCPQGHPYDAANTYVRPDGKGRDCLTCRRARDAVHNERRKV